ncbi:MAG: site-specific DNA-methyltransferase [Bacteroidales bacterium]|nr:site-specific DNA-methyltransferase [Bacteroidales bacterium]
MKATDRHKLIDRINTLEGLADDERSALLGLLRETKTYGLVWEDKPEDVEERLCDELPVLIEDKERALTNAGPDAPNHILIEGDNLEALATLAYTHAGKIDVIYIDPPYNTGNKDFTYNDTYVDSEDDFRHSKWLSFMSKRLRIAKQLLSERGFLFISIDDNEFANLRILCDEIFSSNNFIAAPVRRRRKSQANLSKNISTIHEYVLIYRKSPDFELNKIEANIDLSDYKNPDNDPRGPYKTMPCTNKGGSKYTVTTPTGRVITEEWRFKEETYYALLNDDRLVFPRGGAGKPRYKLFLSDKEDKGVIANSWWAELESNQEGAAMLKEIMNGQDVFSNPKPVGLLKFILTLGSLKDSYILDFFAGSGSTLHAVMQLNAEDGGKRQCILCTNNENGICQKVTYERNKRVIEGYTKPNGEHVEGLHNNNLRYYRTDFVGRSRSTKNMRRLVSLSTDMLCIKENLYTEQKTFAGLPTFKNIYRYFEHGDKKMLVIYDERYVDEIVKMIAVDTGSELNVASAETDSKIKVYVFSPSEDPWEASFESVNDKVELCAVPQAIYNTYKLILPKRRRKLITLPEEEDTLSIDDEEIGGLFNQEGGAE